MYTRQADRFQENIESIVQIFMHIQFEINPVAYHIHTNE